MLNTASSAETLPDAGELRVNGILIAQASIEAEISSQTNEADPGFAARRALVLRELLTQQAHAKGLLDHGMVIDDEAIDRLLVMECPTPEPSEEECQRYYKANARRFRSPDIVHARHILFALTPGVSLSKLRERSEQVRRDLARHPDRFDALARSLSNCPSGKVGGSLGQLSRGETVEEFDKALFGTSQIGLLPGLVTTRHGFHIVLVERRIAGAQLPFEAVCGKIAQYLRDYVRHKAIQQYLTMLVSNAKIEGITLNVVHGPLLQ